MADAADVAGVGLGVGGALGARALAESDLANAILARIMSRRAGRGGYPDLRVPSYAGADINLEHGSGESIMAARIARLLNKNGIRSYYANTTYPFSREELARGLGSWRSDTVRNNAAMWSAENVIDGKHLDRLTDIRTNFGREGNALSEITSRMAEAGVPQEKAIAALRSGMFDGFTPGELVDNLKVLGRAGIQNVISGKETIVPRSRFAARFHSNSLPYAITGEAGMNYNTLIGNADAPRVAQDAFPYGAHGAPDTRNLSLDTKFQANYRTPSDPHAPVDPLIPGVEMHDPGALRRSPAARKWMYYAPRFLGGGERAAYQAAIRRLARSAGVDPKTLGRNTKYMLISTGAAGANATEKLRLAEKAFGSDPNVRILLQYGKANPAPASAGLDMYTNNGVMDEINRINRSRPGFVIPFARDNDYGLLARNVDLHGAYGGSSSATEALGNTNPTVMMADTGLNYGNTNYVRSRRGFDMVDSGRTALRREFERGRGLGDVINTRDNKATLDGAGHVTDNSLTLGKELDRYGLRDANLGAMEEEAVGKLRNAMYNSPGKFDPGTVAAANRMLAEQRARDRGVVGTIAKSVTNAVGRHDNQTFRNASGASKFYRGLSRALMRTPMGRRIGLPLAIAGGIGLGVGAHSLFK